MTGFFLQKPNYGFFHLKHYVLNKCSQFVDVTPFLFVPISLFPYPHLASWPPRNLASSFVLAGLALFYTVMRPAQEVVVLLILVELAAANFRRDVIKQPIMIRKICGVSIPLVNIESVCSSHFNIFLLSTFFASFFFSRSILGNEAIITKRFHYDCNLSDTGKKKARKKSETKR